MRLSYKRKNSLPRQASPFLLILKSIFWVTCIPPKGQRNRYRSIYISSFSFQNNYQVWRCDYRLMINSTKYFLFTSQKQKVNRLYEAHTVNNQVSSEEKDPLERIRHENIRQKELYNVWGLLFLLFCLLDRRLSRVLNLFTVPRRRCLFNIHNHNYQELFSTNLNF